MIKSNIKKDIRFKNLCRIVKQQLEVLNNQDFLKSLKKNADSTYLNEEKK